MKNINTAEAQPSPSQKGEHDNDKDNDDDRNIVHDELSWNLTRCLRTHNNPKLR